MQASLVDAAPSHPLVQYVLSGAGNCLSLFAVLDGHKGARAAIFVKKNLSAMFWTAAIQLGLPDALRLACKQAPMNKSNGMATAAPQPGDTGTNTAHSDSVVSVALSDHCAKTNTMPSKGRGD